MSDLPPLDPLSSDDPDMAAAELALGVLDGEARAVAMRRVLAEPGFAREVEQWRRYLSQLFALWPAMPAPDLLARIERSLDTAAPSAVVPLSVHKPSKFWPGLAALSSLAAAALLVVVITRPLPIAPQAPRLPAAVPAAPTLVASITPSAKGAPVTAVYDARAGAIRLTQAKFAEADRTAELWVIPTGGTPHSLGLLHAQGGTALVLSADNRARIAAGATLAVSIEPIGGSPTGLPTGPVVATGALSPV
uniref:anti-sigma factor n=1 Tax=uncultured Sphingomonas sp. TaxID=158754 RepID=UPI0035CBB80C